MSGDESAGGGGSSTPDLPLSIGQDLSIRVGPEPPRGGMGPQVISNAPYPDSDTETIGITEQKPGKWRTLTSDYLLSADQF